MKTKWFVLFPSAIYAIELFGCKNEKEARQSARDFAKMQRLPKGTEIWGNYN